MCLVQHFPRDVTKNCLKWNLKAIILVDADNGDTYDAEIHCAKRNGKIVWKEKFIIKGWYEYAKKKRFGRQDVLGFKIRYPLERLYVSLLKRSVMRKQGDLVGKDEKDFGRVQLLVGNM